MLGKKFYACARVGSTPDQGVQLEKALYYFFLFHLTYLTCGNLFSSAITFILSMSNN